MATPTALCQRLDAYIKDEEQATEDYKSEAGRATGLTTSMLLKMSADEASHANMLRAIKVYYCGGKSH